MVDVRKGQTSFPIAPKEFHARYQEHFFDPAFDKERDAIDRLEEIAWQNYLKNRKAPRTTKAGPGFADPEYELSDQWRETRNVLIGCSLSLARLGMTAVAREKSPRASVSFRRLRRRCAVKGWRSTGWT